MRFSAFALLALALAFSPAQAENKCQELKKAYDTAAGKAAFEAAFDGFQKAIDLAPAGAAKEAAQKILKDNGFASKSGCIGDSDSNGAASMTASLVLFVGALAAYM